MTKGEVWLQVFLTVANDLRARIAVDEFILGRIYVFADAVAGEWAKRFESDPDRLAAQLIDTAETIEAIRDTLTNEDRLTRASIITLEGILRRDRR